MKSEIREFRKCPKCNEIFELPETNCTIRGFDLTNEEIKRTVIDNNVTITKNSITLGIVFFIEFTSNYNEK